jgi:hypothetical protein
MEHRYIYMYINMVANSVMLQLHLWHDFYNTVFKIKHKLYRAAGSAPHTSEKSWVCTWTWLYCTLIISFYDIVSNSYFMMSKCTTIRKWWIGMDTEGCDCGLSKVLSWHVPGWTKEKHGNYQSGQPKTWQRFEPGISKYNSRHSRSISPFSDALIIFRNICNKIIYSNKILWIHKYGIIRNHTDTELLCHIIWFKEITCNQWPITIPYQINPLCAQGLTYTANRKFRAWSDIVHMTQQSERK